ncbi:MAG: hypothetical protein N2321_08730 [Melioribacteraceae bacterium]|nr:hypothetical protein [Melioribacteraceae bacterium]
MQKLLIKILLFFLSIPFYLFADNIKIDSLQTNQKIKVDSIKIHGNSRTKDFIILRELTFSVGDSVDNKILLFNKERIFSLGLFNRVEVGIDSLLRSKVIIKVDETWYIYPIPFWITEKNSIKNLTFGIDLVWNNFRGRNEVLHAIFGVGYNPFLLFQYVNPALDYDEKIGLSIGIGFYKSKNKNEQAISYLKQNFSYKIIKSNIGLFKRLNQFNLYGLTLGYDYIQTELRNSKLFMASKSEIDRVPYTSFYFINDTRDLKQYPERGNYFFINFIHKGFNLSNVYYSIIKNDFRFYQKLFSNLILKERFVLRNTFGKNIPLYDYSYFGYEDKIRGYNNLFFEGQNSFLTSYEVALPILKEWNLSFDLPLIPKSLTSARIGIYTSIFFDSGITYKNINEIKLSKFNSGYGIGLIILILPFEIVRLEYSFNKFGKGEFVIANRYSF